MPWHYLFRLKLNFVAWMFTFYASWDMTFQMVTQAILKFIKKWKTNGLTDATSTELPQMSLGKYIGIKCRVGETQDTGLTA